MSPFPWRRLCIQLFLVLVQLRPGESCHIHRCNADFVRAQGGGASYCSALRSFAACAKRTARTCRGDLAYHSAVQGIEDLLIQHGCPRVGPMAKPRPQHAAPQMLSCSVHGNVRTFRNESQSCALQGAWPLIDNRFLYVQISGEPDGRRGFRLTQVSVIIKHWRRCVDQQLYRAELDLMPAAFADGSVRSGEHLTVHSQNPGRQAEIRAAHIGTLLLVWQSGRSLGVAVASPRGVVEAYGAEQDLQLCVFGCPASHSIPAAGRGLKLRPHSALIWVLILFPKVL